MPIPIRQNDADPTRSGFGSTTLVLNREHPSKNKVLIKLLRSEVGPHIQCIRSFLKHVKPKIKKKFQPIQHKFSAATLKRLLRNVGLSAMAGSGSANTIGNVPVLSDPSLNYTTTQIFEPRRLPRQEWE
jgi:hypothetical protein